MMMLAELTCLIHLQPTGNDIRR